MKRINHVVVGSDSYLRVWVFGPYAKDEAEKKLVKLEKKYQSLDWVVMKARKTV